MMMVMGMGTKMVNVCDDDCYLMVMKVILVKEVMSCDVLPVAICINLSSLPRLCGGWSQTGRKFCRRVFGSLFTHGRLLGFAVFATKAKLHIAIREPGYSGLKAVRLWQP